MSKLLDYPRFKQRQQRRLAVFFLLLVPAVFLSATLVKVDFSLFSRLNYRTFSLLSDFAHPNWALLPDMVVAALETILVAMLGTLLGAVISFGFAVLAANNLHSRWVNAVSRFLIALERSVSEVLIVLFLIVIFGLGLFPGVVAIAIACIGMLGKLYAESIEEIPAATLDSIRATGAGPTQVILFGVLPNVLPALISHTILRFEINIRASVMLGAIGAGGLGYELQKAYRYAAYSDMTVAILAILVLVFSSEQVSAFLRRRLIKPEKLS